MIIQLFALLISAHAAEKNFSPSPLECGEYQINGVVRSQKLIIHEKTQSQITLSFPESASALLDAYKDVDVSLVTVLDQKFDGTNAKASSLTKIQLRVPNALNPRDTGFNLIKSQDCQKL